MTIQLKSIDVASETLERVVSAGSQAVKQSGDKALKGLSTVAAFNKNTAEAVLASANATFKGVQALQAENLAFYKAALQDAVTAAQAAANCRSLQGLIEVNSSFAKTAFESYVGQLTKVNQMILDLAKSAAEPLKGHTAALVETIQSARKA